MYSSFINFRNAW